MSSGRQLPQIRALLIVAAIVAAPVIGSAQTLDANAVRLSDNLVPAPDGYERVTAKYVTTKQTDVYISPFIWGGKVMGARFAAGQPLEVVARPKGYDWLLVGRNGTTLGYVPLSVVAIAK
jgi:hypothetical protein